jgi:hypothetical protein
MAATGGNREARREAVALLLACGRTQKQAAAETKVSERCIRNWLGEGPFRNRVQELQAELFAQAVGRLAGIGGKAVDTLERLLDSANDAVAVSAAKAVLEAGPRLREAVVWAREIEELKRQVAEVQRARGEYEERRAEDPGAAGPADGNGGDGGPPDGEPGRVPP